MFDRTGRAGKNHAGVRTEFSRIAKDDPAELPVFLRQAYLYKEVSDYGAVSAKPVTMETAAEAFIKIVRAALDH